jgi:hypothetical protein
LAFPKRHLFKPRPRVRQLQLLEVCLMDHGIPRG